MKTATSLAALSRPIGRGSLHKSIAIMASAVVATLGIGLALPLAAQDATERTIATGTGIPLAAEAPDRYTVKQGDTLWDIAKVFLRDPWYWPEIWYLNPQVKNPHLIYPGDVLAMLSVNGQPQVQVAERGPDGAAAEAEPVPEPEGTPRSGGGVRLSPKVRSTPITAAVTAIPYEAVAAFMGKPSLLTKEEVKKQPYLVGVRDQHLIGGDDNEVYARGIGDATAGTRYNFVHIVDEMRDPDTNKVLGYRGVYSGMGTVAVPGDPSKLAVGQASREVLRGDKLFPDEVKVNLDFLPHPVAEEMSGTIMAVSGVMIVGSWQVVAINRGTKHGLELGHVLAVNQKGETVRDNYKEGNKKDFWSIGSNVRLPDERIGVIMVFKTYERMSYAMIMDSTHPIRIGDMVGTP